MLCEFTQNDIIKANRELHKEGAQTEQLIMQYQETDQANTTLKNRHGVLENELYRMRQPVKRDDAEPGQENMPPPGYNLHGYPMYPKKKTKSVHAMFGAESNFDQANKERKRGFEKEEEERKKT